VVALWVIARVPEDRPAEEGKNRMITNVDCPGFREKAPPPPTTENGGDNAGTFPINGPIELDELVMVIILSDDCPAVTFPKFTEGATTEMLIPGAATLTVPTMPKTQWIMQK
jgi:hypothetical protein